MSWRVHVLNRAKRDLRKLDARTADRVIRGLERYAETGHGDIVKLTDVDPPEWRLRVGNWRVFLDRDTDARVLYVLRVRLRNKAY